MTTITAADTYFTSIISGVTAQQWESFIDQAVDKINGYAHTTLLPNMKGTAGTKTLNVESRAAGFIRSLTVLIYMKEYKLAGAQSKSISMGGVSKSESSSASSSSGSTASDIEELAKAAADNLQETDWSRSII